MDLNSQPPFGKALVLPHKPAIFFLHQQIKHAILKSRSNENFGKDLIDRHCCLHIKRTVKSDNAAERGLSIG